jgi:hypothetical protein
MSDPWGGRPAGEPGPDDPPGPEDAAEPAPQAPPGGQAQQPPPPGGQAQQAGGYGQPGGYPPPAYPGGYGPPGQGYGAPPPGYGGPVQGGYGPPPPGYGPPAYSTTAYGYGSYLPTTSGKATTVMVLGIVSLVLLVMCGVGFIPAIIALVMTGGARREIAESGGTLTGESQLRAGQIMSWVTLGLTGLLVLVIAGFLAIGIAASGP